VVFLVLNIIHDGSVKSPDALLRRILRRCGVCQDTPHSSRFARLACGLFTKPAKIQQISNFFEGVIHDCSRQRGRFLIPIR
jgi:hypothetical protein